MAALMALQCCSSSHLLERGREGTGKGEWGVKDGAYSQHCIYGGSVCGLLRFLLLPALPLLLLEGRAAFRTSTCSAVPLIGIS